jgi:ribose transport system permease protein
MSSKGTSGVLSRLSFSDISAVYILVIMLLVFALWIPDRFLQSGVWRSLVDAGALTALAALGALIPMVCGALNLAIGSQVGFAAISTAVFFQRLDMPIALQFPSVLVCGAVIGLLTGLLVTWVKIDPIITTLGTSSILLAGMTWISGGHQVLFSTVQPNYGKIATSTLFGITVPVYILVVVALVLWFVLERTAVGRRMYAVGFNPQSARLAGVRVNRLVVGSLAVGGLVAALAGALLTSRFNSGDPTLGPGYLLPALTALFLGSTQFKGGRFNVWGTVFSLYVLDVGIKGLQLAGAPSWVEDMFYGLALLIAVALSRMEGSNKRFSAIRRATRLRTAVSAQQ